jgi:hypothetical protein
MGKFKTSYKLSTELICVKLYLNTFSTKLNYALVNEGRHSKYEKGYFQNNGTFGISNVPIYLYVAVNRFTKFNPFNLN